MAKHYYNGHTGEYLGTKKPSAAAASYVVELGSKHDKLPPNWNAGAYKVNGVKGTASAASALWGTRYGEATGLLNKLTDQQLQDLRQSYRSLDSTVSNQLVDSGMQTSTMLGAMRRGIKKDEQAQVNLLNDQLARERLGVMGEYATGQAGAMDSDAERATQAGIARMQAANDLKIAAMNNQTRMNLGVMDSVARNNASTRAAKAASSSKKGSVSSVFTGRTNYHPGGAGSATAMSYSDAIASANPYTGYTRSYPPSTQGSRYANGTGYKGRIMKG